MATAGIEPQSVRGKPAAVCPYCGAGLLIDGTNRTEYDIVRYVECRNKNCGKRFMTRQPPAKLVKEIKDSSVSGKPSLQLVRESA